MMQGLTSPGDRTRIHRFTRWRTMSRRVFHPRASSGIYGTWSRWQVTSILVAILSGALIVGGPFLGTIGLRGDGSVMAAVVPSTTQSTTIALTSNDQRLVVVNRESNSVAVIQVRDNNKDVAKKLAEITVGEEPRCVALHPNDRLAFVVNGVSGTVSVVDIKQFTVVAEIPVGTEPRGCALTPHGTMLYVANHTEGTVSIIDTSMRKVVGTVPVGGNPTAIAITNDGDNSDKDERVFVPQIFAELNPDFVDPNFNGNGEGRDLGKRGVVHTFTVANPNAIQKITLSPLSNSGFNASRTNFCTKLVPPNPTLSSSARTRPWLELIP